MILLTDDDLIAFLEMGSKGVGENEDIKRGRRADDNLIGLGVEQRRSGSPRGGLSVKPDADPMEPSSVLILTDTH